MTAGPEDLTRRALLAGGTALAAALACNAGQAASGQRVAAIDWALLETLLAFGTPPVAATELRQYERLALGGRLPADVADLGLRGAVSYEALIAARPDLVLISQFYESLRPQLEKIARVVSVPTYDPARPALDVAREATRALGAAVSDTAVADDLVRAVDRDLETARARLADRTARPVFAINIGDARHFRAFGADSLAGGVLSALGLRNAWQGATSYSASAPVDLAVLARHPDASVLVLGPVPDDVRRSVGDSRLWRALPMVREGRTAWLGDHNHFGALPTARLLAGEVVTALGEGRHG